MENIVANSTRPVGVVSGSFASQCTGVFSGIAARVSALVSKVLGYWGASGLLGKILMFGGGVAAGVGVGFCAYKVCAKVYSVVKGYWSNTPPL